MLTFWAQSHSVDAGCWPLIGVRAAKIPSQNARRGQTGKKRRERGKNEEHFGKERDNNNRAVRDSNEL